MLLFVEYTQDNQYWNVSLNQNYVYDEIKREKK